MFCRRGGAVLAIVETEAENKLLQDKIRRFGGSGESWWLGATRRVNGWRWVTESGTKELRFTDWERGEPNNNGGRQQRICIWQRSLQWADYDGAERLHFICEFDARGNAKADRFF